MKIEARYNDNTDKRFRNKCQDLIKQYDEQYDYIKFYHKINIPKTVFIINKLKNAEDIHYLIIYMAQQSDDIKRDISKNEILSIVKYIITALDSRDYYTYNYQLPYAFLYCYSRYIDINSIDDIFIELCNKHIIFYNTFQMLIPFCIRHTSAQYAAKIITAYIEHFFDIQDEYKYKLLQYIDKRLSEQEFYAIKQLLTDKVLSIIMFITEYQ